MLVLDKYIPGVLSPYVKSFWYLEFNDSSGKPYEEDIIPDGHHEIIFHLCPGSGQRKNNKNEWMNEPDAFLAGQTLRSYTMRLQPGSILYGIRFYPHTLSIFFNFPASIATDTIIPIHEIPEARILNRCVTACRKKTFFNFEKILSQRIKTLHHLPGSFRFLSASVEILLRNKGAAKIDDLLHLTGISGRYLDTIFKQFVGINPKAFANIIKLNAFISHKKTHLVENFTQCSYEAGFYDQSHLIKIFRNISGETPRSFFKKGNIISEIFADL